jgi:hypothetical protein
MHFLKEFFDGASQSAEALNRQIIRITQRNLNAGLDLAKSLASARDPFEIANLQASFWWKQFNEFSAQAEDVRRRLFGAAIDPERTAEPDFASQPERPRESLKESATKLLTRPKHEHRPATHDPTNARPKKKPDKQKVETPTLAAQTPKAAESDARRPKPRLQKNTAEKRSTRYRPTSRDAARNQGERKSKATRTLTRQVTQADAPRVAKFGMLDGNAVRFTNLEAWWLVDGAWRPVSPAEVHSNAAVMREARFKEVFPQVPILPRNAFQSAAEGAKKEPLDDYERRRGES